MLELSCRRPADQCLQIGFCRFASSRLIRQVAREKPNQFSIATPIDIEHGKVKFVVGDDVDAIAGNDHAACSAEIPDCSW